MARGGINKAAVQTARIALMARGEYPSIDAVRVEMGNTGSKTTIHRHLKELDETDQQRSTPADIGDELTELVTRLAGRLQGQAQEIIDEAQAEFDSSRRQLQEALLHTQKKLADTADRLTDESAQLAKETAALLATREQLQTEQTANARLTQANQDMADRLNDKDERIRSLEEKHLHARAALETTRQQHEQELRRHEGQTQVMQTELRNMQHIASQRQEQIIQLTRDNERLLAQTRSAEDALQSQNDQLDKANTQATSMTEQFQHSEGRCALLEERARAAQQQSTDARQQLTDQLQQNRVLELILIKTELALENLRATQPHDSPQNTHPDQV